MSQLEDTFEHYWNTLTFDDAPTPVSEYRFDAKRKWRFDFCWPYAKLAVEIEGGTHGNGRHNRDAGYTNDCEKYNAAVLAGWRVLRYTSSMLRRDPYSVMQQVGQALGVKVRELDS